MIRIDFSDLEPKRKPTKKEKALYKKWVKYLKDSNLSDREIHSRAASFTEQKLPIPKD